MSSSDECWEHIRCCRFRISLNHLKTHVASKILTMAGWKMEGGHEWLINKYCLKHPVYNLDSIFVAMHPKFNDTENAICPSYYPNTYVENESDKYCDEDEFVENDYLEDFKEQECFYLNTEKFGALMPDKTMIGRNWGDFKHTVFHISIHDLKDSVKRAVLYQTGWLTSLSVPADELKIAVSIYSLNCTNSNLWSFRILDESVDSTTIKHWNPEEYNENEKKHTNNSKNNQEHHNTGKTLNDIFTEIKEKIENKKNDKYNYLNKKRLFQSELCKLPELKFDNETNIEHNDNQSRCKSCPPTSNSNVNDVETIDAEKFFDYNSDDSCSSMPPLIEDDNSEFSYHQENYPVENNNVYNENEKNLINESDIFYKKYEDIVDDDSTDYNWYKSYADDSN